MTPGSLFGGRSLRIIFLCAAVGCCGCELPRSRLLAKHMEEPHSSRAEKQWGSVRSSVRVRLAEQHLQAGRLDEAERALEEALAESIDNGSAYYVAARLRLEQGRLADARQAVRLALSLSPDKHETEFLAGVIEQRCGDFEKALSYFRAASRKAPNQESYLLTEVEALLILDRSIEALELIESRVNDFDGDATLRLMAARIYRLLGLRGPAVAWGREAAALAEDDPEVTAEFGRMLVWAERYEEAIAVLRPLAGPRAMHQVFMPTEAEATVSPEPIPAGAIEALARACYETGRWEEARQVLKPLMARDGLDVSAWCLFARASLMLNDSDAASEALATLRRRGAAPSEALLLAAYVAYRRGDLPAMKEAAEGALALDDSLAEARWMLDHSNGHNKPVDGSAATTGAIPETVSNPRPRFHEGLSQELVEPHPEELRQAARVDGPASEDLEATILSEAGNP